MNTKRGEEMHASMRHIEEFEGLLVAQEKEVHGCSLE